MTACHDDNGAPTDVKNEHYKERRKLSRLLRTMMRVRLDVDDWEPETPKYLKDGRR